MEEITERMTIGLGRLTEFFGLSYADTLAIAVTIVGVFVWAHRVCISKESKKGSSWLLLYTMAIYLLALCGTLLILWFASSSAAQLHPELLQAASGLLTSAFACFMGAVVLFVIRAYKIRKPYRNADHGSL